MEKDQQNINYIVNLLSRLDEGDFSVRGKLSDDDKDYNEIVQAINKLAVKLNNLYESGREFENKINEIIEIIVAYASLNFSRKINNVSRTNILYPVTTGLKILGKELAELTVEKNYFETMLKVLPDMLVILDSKGIIETVNNVVLETLEYSKNELIGNPIKAILKDDFILFQGPTRERILSNGLISNLDKFFITREGMKIPVSLSVSIVFDRKKEIQGYICVAHDMTQYKRNEKMLNLKMKELAEARSAALNMMEDAYEANKSKTTFLTNMSHELRTPMSAIIGISQILMGQSRSENLTEEQKEGIEIINDSGKRLLSLINDILDLSKIDVGKMEIEYSQFSLSGVIANLEKITKNLIGDKNIQLIVLQDSMLPETLISDEKKVNQVLLNVMGNAVKFTDEGKIILRVYLKEERIYFEIEDTGIGIKKDQIQFLFEEFRQLDGSKSRKYPGTGLGLSLSKKMIQLLNGKIMVESEFNKGTKILFYIPYLRNEDLVKSTPDIYYKDEERVRDNQQSVIQKPLILITDDEDICQFTVKMMLKQHYELVFAKTGIEAVDKYFKRKPQVVLMDIMMPEMDGYKAFKQIREKDTGRKVPIIAVTARAMEEDKEKIIQFGFDDYISKPFDVKLLDKKIRKFLE